MEIRMIDRKEIKILSILLSGAVAAYGAGAHLEYSKAPAQQTLLLGTTTNTSSAAVVMFNPTTFAEVDPAPPVVPPGYRQQQG
jgi:hypothetical protein